MLYSLIGFSADTTNSMFGVRHSVSILLKEKVPWILNVKCSCHSIHLCASYTTKRLPMDLEDAVRGIFNHLSHSSARRRSFEEFQTFVQLALHKILSPGQTRWLSLENCVNRLLEQLPALKLYFLAEYAEDKRRHVTQF